MHIYISVHMYICIYVYMYLEIYVYLSIYLYVCLDIMYVSLTVNEACQTNQRREKYKCLVNINMGTHFSGTKSKGKNSTNVFERGAYYPGVCVCVWRGVCVCLCGGVCGVGCGVWCVRCVWCVVCAVENCVSSGTKRTHCRETNERANADILEHK